MLINHNDNKEKQLENVKINALQPFYLCGAKFYFTSTTSP